MAAKEPVVVKEEDKYSSDLTFYRFIIHSLPVGVLTVNSKLKITSFNPWAETVTGYSAKEAMGRYCGDILLGGDVQAQLPVKNSH